MVPTRICATSGVPHVIRQTGSLDSRFLDLWRGHSPGACEPAGQHSSFAFSTLVISDAPGRQHADSGTANTSANCSAISVSAPEARRRRKTLIRVDAIIWAEGLRRAQALTGSVRRHAVRFPDLPDYSGVSGVMPSLASVATDRLQESFPNSRGSDNRIRLPCGSDPDLCCSSSPWGRGRPPTARTRPRDPGRRRSRSRAGTASSRRSPGRCKASDRLVRAPSAVVPGRRFRRVNHMARVPRRLGIAPGVEHDRPGREKESAENQIG